ncbi:CU044_5270 family protein [Streptomyces sp. NPDC047461]|uniref:CU044_5270 family protein n=1 Tax=Streptomyces sp. NPDC047461 TaxID=3155619 RepID=UPI0033CFF08F
MRDIDEALRALDPARLAGEDEAPSQTQAQLEAIVRTSRPALVARPRVRRSRRWVPAGVSVVASTAIVLVVANPFGTTAQPAYAVTPRPLAYQATDRPADQVLEEMALRIADLPDDRPTTWSVEHFVRDSWSLFTRIDGLQVTSAVIPEHRETWEKPDGSSRWTVKTLPPQFQNTEQRKTWEDAGAVGQTSEESSDAAPATAQASEPPSTPEGMEKWLASGHSSLTSGLAFEVVPERFMDHVFSPAQRAAVLRVLKDMDGIVYAGVVRDRAGREGQAFSLTSGFGGLPNKRTLVFDPSTGSLLAYEEELTSDPGALNVKTPAVIDYSTFLTAERVP